MIRKIGIAAILLAVAGMTAGTLLMGSADARRAPLRAYTCGTSTLDDHDVYVLNTSGRAANITVAKYDANGFPLGSPFVLEQQPALSQSSLPDQDFFAIQFKSRAKLLVFGEQGNGDPLNCTR